LDQASAQSAPSEIENAEAPIKDEDQPSDTAKRQKLA